MWVGKTAQQVKGLAAKPSNLSLILMTHEMEREERNDYSKLFSSLHIHISTVTGFFFIVFYFYLMGMGVLPALCIPISGTF